MPYFFVEIKRLYPLAAHSDYAKARGSFTVETKQNHAMTGYS